MFNKNIKLNLQNNAEMNLEVKVRKEFPKSIVRRMDNLMSRMKNIVYQCETLSILNCLDDELKEALNNNDEDEILEIKDLMLEILADLENYSRDSEIKMKELREYIPLLREYSRENKSLMELYDNYNKTFGGKE